MVCRSADRMWRLSRLGVEAPSVCLRCLRRSLRLRGGQHDDRPQRQGSLFRRAVFLRDCNRNGGSGFPHRAPLREAGVRLYTESSQEILRARKLLTQWTADGSLSREQYELLEQDTVSDLRTTYIFLSLVLFLFSVIAVAAIVGLSSLIFTGSSQQAAGIFYLIFAA